MAKTRRVLSDSLFDLERLVDDDRLSTKCRDSGLHEGFYHALSDRGLMKRLGNRNLDSLA